MLILGFSAHENVREKNAKIFIRILHTFSRNFTFFRKYELSEKM